MRSATVGYIITIQTDEADLLRRVSIINSAMFRILREAKLRSVWLADYAGGKLQLLVEAGEADPSVVPGEANVRVERV